MPNWCQNNVSITGPKDKITALWETAQTAFVYEADGETKRDFGLLNAMVPLGKDWDRQNCIDSWGTKWDVSDEGLELVENDDGTASIDGWFDSAWAPPLPAMMAYQTLNDDVDITLTYFEPGMSFCGQYMNQVDEEYEIEPEDLSNIPSDLVEEFAIDDYFDDEDEDEDL